VEARYNYAMATQTTTHLRNCHLCEAMCGVVIETDGATIVSVKGDFDDPFSRGHICPKAPALAELHTDPDRLKGPLKRVADQFEPIAWDTALDEIADRLTAVQRTYGRDTVATYLGNPTVHNHGATLLAPVFVHTLHTKSRYSATSVDQLPHQLASWAMLGHQLLLPVPDIDRTRFMLMIGANPLASNGSLMTAPDIKGRLKALRERGGRLIVVDPRRTETARVADEHVFIRPGSDALFLLALTQVIFAAGGPRLGHLAPLVRNVEALQAAVAEFTPERVASATGIPAATIRRIANELRAADPGVVYARLGASTQAFGGICQWLVPALNIITGNFDRVGGAMFTKPAVDVLGAAKLAGIGRGSLGRWKSRVRQLPEANGELPAATLAEDMLAPGEGKLRALVVMAGNPVLSTPNGKQMDKALAGLDLMVSIDCYLNETSRHAHYILPPASPLTRSHYDVALSLLAVRNVAKWSPPVFEPPADARHDWQILLGLAERIEQRKPLSIVRRATLATWRRLGPDGIVDLLLRLGPYGRLGQRTLRGLLREGLSLAQLKQHPHGVDLGPLEPALPGRLMKDRRYIDLAPALFIADLPRLQALLTQPAPSDGELLLIGRRHLRSNNSWMHNAPRLAGGKPRCTLIVSPGDATRLGLSEGQKARVTSQRGEVEVAVEVSDDMMPGVVSLPHGFGHRGPNVRLAVAGREEHAGVSMNDLTDERDVDALCGTAVLTGVPVRVSVA